MQPSPIRQRTVRGFTIVELLVVVAILVVLAALVLSILPRLRNHTSSMKSGANLREIYAGIQLYSTDHNGRLPGPVWSSQGPYFSAREGDLGGNPGSLASILHEYLGSEHAGDGKGYSAAFDYPNWKRMARQETAPSYSIKRAVRVNGRLHFPMGMSRVGDGTIGETMTAFQIASLNIPSDEIWIQEIDGGAANPNAGWYGGLPPGPVHKNHRNALFFDGSVRKVSVEASSTPY